MSEALPSTGQQTSNRLEQGRSTVVLFNCQKSPRSRCSGLIRSQGADPDVFPPELRIIVFIPRRYKVSVIGDCSVCSKEALFRFTEIF